MAAANTMMAGPTKRRLRRGVPDLKAKKLDIRLDLDEKRLKAMGQVSMNIPRQARSMMGAVP
jgi:hypothetical protein